jgi:hypothetical protein
MATEHLVAVALPHSVDPGADFHASIYIAPRLTPDDGEAPLGTFEHFPHWADLLTQGRVEIGLRNQSGPIDAEPVLGDVDRDAWDAAFPEDTSVRSRQNPDWSRRHWRSFRAAEVHQYGKLFHLVSMISGPTDPPPPLMHPLTEPLLRLGGSIRQEPYDERNVTLQYDRRVGETAGLGGDALSLNGIEARIDDAEPLDRILMNLHRARRMYERPEAQFAYQERPDQPSPQFPRPEPDFHERVGMVGDHPSVQRRLGLVIDLVVSDPAALARLAQSDWIAADVVPAGDDAACLPTRTKCTRIGNDLVTVSESDDWLHERLRLGDPSHFHVLDVDPDGTALKLDRFLMTLPRLGLAQRNGNRVHAAPTALRSLGFTVVRNRRGIATQERMGRQAILEADMLLGDPPLLCTEDVAQGMRVEVWDETAGAWFSLHSRVVDAEVDGHGQVLGGLEEEGFVQGTTAAETGGVDDGPIHVHESVFGWEGWSLSAPRYGRRVRHQDGDEIVEDDAVDPNPITPIVIRNRVRDGTLPRLRYGRSYAFRAWAVNLAGNSRPHAIGVPPPVPPSAPASFSAAIAAATAGIGPTEPIEPFLRAGTAAAVTKVRAATPATPQRIDARELRLADDDAVDRRIAARLRRGGRAATRLGSRGEMPLVTRATQIRQAFETVVETETPMVVETATLDPAILSRASGHDFAEVGAQAELDWVTPLHPFLRWDPVQPPTVVPRRAYSAGESLLQIVIRSGVSQDLETLDVAVTDPAAYAAAHTALGYQATSERHFAPPKASQTEAELHGAFDQAIGSTDPADHQAMLNIAVREAGTWFDMEVPRLDDPTQTVLQQGIGIVYDPSVPDSVKKKMPLAPNDLPAPGQYVIHDTDELHVPYLPDFLAHGISLVFPDAGRDRLIPFPFGVEGFTAPYEGDWPVPEPFRFVLAGDDELRGELDGKVLTIGVPAGNTLRFRLSSSLDRADLELFGLWRILPEVVRNLDVAAEAVADGWLWAYTPFDEITLVHAVPRPLEAPRVTVLAPRRAKGSTDVLLVGAVDVHGPSTDSLTLEAAWVDPLDDLALPEPIESSQKGIAYTTAIHPDEDIALLWLGDDEIDVEGYGPVRTHASIHRLPDTRHRVIDYRYRAATRFREYFDTEALTPTPSPPGVEPGLDDGQSTVGPIEQVSVPSSARPTPPIVHSVLPLFRWEEQTEPEQPMGVRRRRRAGVRIYLERPWFSSGAGELLGVLIAPADDDSELDGLVSQWGQDPLWVSAPVDNRAMFTELETFVTALDFDDRTPDAGPVTFGADLPLTAVPGGKVVSVLGYEPQYNLDRQLWYVDVAIDPGSTFWPFVRLAIARYQPESVSGCHLSAPVLCDYVQLAPERTTSVSRTDAEHVRVVVSGPWGARPQPRTGTGIAPVPAALQLVQEIQRHRRVVARLQRQDPDFPTDLGWETVDATELDIVGFGANVAEVSWVGALEAAEPIDLTRPLGHGEEGEWRVTVEEWERLLGDPAVVTLPADEDPNDRLWEHRLVYADELTL